MHFLAVLCLVVVGVNSRRCHARLVCCGVDGVDGVDAKVML